MVVLDGTVTTQGRSGDAGCQCGVTGTLFAGDLRQAAAPCRGPDSIYFRQQFPKKVPAMNPLTRWVLISVTGVTLAFGFTVDTANAQWGHQNMAWVLGPDSAAIRSPHEPAQPTGFSWSIVPGNTEALFYPGSNIIDDKITQEITDLNAVGLDGFEDYKHVLGTVIDAWANVSGIENLGYVEETGDVLVGGVENILSRPDAGVGHIRFMAYDSPVIPAHVYASATYIPEPGVTTDMAVNRSRAGDVRFRSDANIWAMGGDDGFYFRKIAMHEVGHVLGFAHNSISDSVMGGGLYSEPGLGQGDIAGAVAIYGVLVPEPTTLSLLAVGMLLVRQRR